MNPEVLRSILMEAKRMLDEQCQQARAERRAKGSRHDIDPNALKPAKRWVGRLDGYGIALIRGEFYEVPATPPLFPDIRDVDVFHPISAARSTRVGRLARSCE